MVRGKKNVPIVFLPQQFYDILKIIGIYASARFILHIAQVDFDKGLIMLVEESEHIPAFTKALTEELGAVIVKNINSKKILVPNNITIVHVYHKYDSREAVFRFMEAEEFFSVLVIGGVIPEDIGEAAYILKVEHTSGLSSDHCIQEELKSVASFVKNNASIVQKELSLLKTSERFINSENNGSAFWVGLMAAESIYKLYFRDTHTEYDTLLKEERLCEAINRCVLKARELREKEDVVDAVKKVVFDYLMHHSDIICGSVDKIEGDLNVKLKNGLAILYDSNFYFVPEALFKYACSSLLQSVSFTEIKRQLKENGIIICNNTDTTNFTVKKVLITSYGEKVRDRYLKIRKEFFCTYEGLELKDGRENLCTSEKLEIIQ